MTAGMHEQINIKVMTVVSVHSVFCQFMLGSDASDHCTDTLEQDLSVQLEM